MLKKLFFTAAAAAVVSMPLAGLAWADPDLPNDPPGQRDTNSGQPGIPGAAGDVADAFGTNPNPGEPVTPGAVFNIAKDNYAGRNTPEQYGNALEDILGTDFGPVPPGLGVKSATPACSSGRTGGGLGLCS